MPASRPQQTRAEQHRAAPGGGTTGSAGSRQTPAALHPGAAADSTYDTAPSNSHLPPSSATQAPVPAKRVRYNVACAKCGYNLKGLAAKGLCPECAAPIRHSLDTSGSLSLPAEAVRQIALGSLILQLSILACLIVGAITAILGTFGHALGFELRVEVAMAILALPVLGVVVGTWLIAVSPPRSDDDGLPMAPASIAARLLCIAAVITPPLLLVYQPTAVGPGIVPAGPLLFPILGVLGVPLCILAAMIAAAVSARSTSNRLGSPEVAADCWEAKVWGLTNIVPAALFGLALLTRAYPILFLTIPLGLITVVGFLGYYASMAGSLRNRCRELLAIAKPLRPPTPRDGRPTKPHA